MECAARGEELWIRDKHNLPSYKQHEAACGQGVPRRVVSLLEEKPRRHEKLTIRGRNDITNLPAEIEEK